MSFRELTYFSVGGAGLFFSICLIELAALSAGNTLIGNTIGITPRDLQYMNIIATFIGFGTTALRSYIIDNTRGKNGKYRPYLRTMGYPTVFLTIAMVWMPYEHMSYNLKFMLVLVFFIVIQFFYNFYRNSYTGLSQVITPNSQERTTIWTISTFVWSFAPTVYNFIIPMLCKYTGGMTSLWTYRILYPPFCIMGLFLARMIFKGTKERIVLAKSHFNQVPFAEGIRILIKNKYFWITQIAGLMTFLEAASGVLYFWSFQYGKIGTMELYATVMLIKNSSSLFSMGITPYLVKKLGKRKIMIFTNTANVIFLAALYNAYHKLVPLVVFLFLNMFVSTIYDIIAPSVEADIRDQVHYSSGVRLDGMFGTVGLIGSIIGIFTGLILPKIYAYKGLTNNYDVLYDLKILNPLLEVLIIASVIGAILNLIPYLFYDLTEDKQRGMVKVLRIRAMFEDFGNGTLRDETLIEGVDIIRRAKEVYKSEKAVITNENIKNARALPRDTDAKRAIRKQAVKAAKKEIDTLTQLNNDIDSSNYVIDELNKYSSSDTREFLNIAHSIFIRGIEGLYEFEFDFDIPEKSKSNKEQRKKIIDMRRDVYNSFKNINKYYPGGNIIHPNVAEMEALYDLPENTKEELQYKRKTVREMERERSRYNKATNAYNKAQLIFIQKENYTRTNEIFAMYDKAVERIAERARIEDEERLRDEAVRKAEYEKAKREKALLKENKNNKK